MLFFHKMSENHKNGLYKKRFNKKTIGVELIW